MITRRPSTEREETALRALDTLHSFVKERLERYHDIENESGRYPEPPESNFYDALLSLEAALSSDGWVIGQEVNTATVLSPNGERAPRLELPF